MTIRNSKRLNLFYAALGLLIIAIVFFKSNGDFDSDKNLLTINIFCGLFFGTISSYFVFKAYDRRPLYKIDNNKIYLKNGERSYEFKDLRYYRHERLGSRYGSFDYIYFYNADRNLIFKILITGTAHSLEEVTYKIKSKLDKY